MSDYFYRVGTKAGKGRYVVNDDEFNELVEGFSKLRSKKEIKNFLSDILTRRELAETIRRWLVGRMLMESTTYEEIVDRTGMADKTISEISDRLLNGTGMLFKTIERTSHHATQAEMIAHRQKEYAIDRGRSPIDRAFRRRLRLLG